MDKKEKKHYLVPAYVSEDNSIKFIEKLGRKPRGKDFVESLKEKHKIK